MKKQICPLLSSANKKIRCVEHECVMWTQVIGTHPQTGEQMNRWACAIAWIPTLLIEVANESRKTQASVQHFNNQIHMTALALQRGVEVPPLSGNLERDLALIRQFRAGGAERQLADAG